MATHKITEVLDVLQKKVASLRQIYKLYPDTIVKEVSGSELYFSPSLNKDADTVRFGWQGSWCYAHVSKIIGCIEVNSIPEKFPIFLYYPADLFKELTIQSYHASMLKHDISPKLIRDCDLKILSFVKERKIDLSKSNLNDSSEDIRKLLLLL